METKNLLKPVPPAQHLKVLLLRLLLGTATLINVGCAKENLTTATTNDIDSKLSANVIYGTDGRLDLYQVSDQNVKNLADSTVALVKNSDLSTQGGITSIAGKNFGSSYQLCSSEKYREQNTSAFCSGSLVGTDTIITAGHCITNQSDCGSTSFIFGFAVKSAGVLPSQVNASEVYHCREIIKQVLTNGADYAVIKLDRAVTNHAVLRIRGSGEASVGDPLIVIGHPVGLPTKITTGGQVRSVANADFLVTNLDTYGGNSGSAVFNANTGLIEGILVRGEQDFTYQGGCTVSKVCADGSCRGEDVTRISVVRNYIPVQAQPVPPPTPAPTPQPAPTPAPTPAPAPEVDTFTSVQVLSIPDNNTVGIRSLLNVSAAPRGRKVLISVNVVHPYVGDLVLKVVASDGKIVSLHNRSGGSADNIVKTYDATGALGGVTSTGSYKLVVQDLAARDMGSVKSWSVKFQ